MKKRYRVMLVLAILVVTICALALVADATEMKTGIGIVNVSSLRVRSQPSTDSEVVTTAHYGDSVVIIRKVDDWYLVNCNLEIGYMYADYLTVKEKENVKLGYASFDVACNVRSGPGTGYDVAKKAPAGETCFIVGFNCGWYKVSFNGTPGYVRSDLLTLLEKPYENYGSPGNTYKESKSGGSTNSTLGSKVVNLAMQYLGYKYVHGGASPSTGFDCSGFTSYLYAQFGYSIGRTSAAQYSTGTYVSRSDLRPGDVVLFEKTYSSSAVATHSGLYIGNGQFIHAANSRKGVIITSLSETYYSTRFLCGRRYG